MLQVPIIHQTKYIKANWRTSWLHLKTQSSPEHCAMSSCDVAGYSSIAPLSHTADKLQHTASYEHSEHDASSCNDTQISFCKCRKNGVPFQPFRSRPRHMRPERITQKKLVKYWHCIIVTFEPLNNSFNRLKSKELCLAAIAYGITGKQKVLESCYFTIV